MKLSGQSVPVDTLLLARISDKLNILVWFQTEDGQKGKNRPTPLLDLFTRNEKTEVEKDVVVFNSGEDFEEVRQRLIQIGGE